MPSNRNLMSELSVQLGGKGLHCYERENPEVYPQNSKQYLMLEFVVEKNR